MALHLLVPSSLVTSPQGLASARRAQSEQSAFGRSYAFKSSQGLPATPSLSRSLATTVRRATVCTAIENPAAGTEKTPVHDTLAAIDLLVPGAADDFQALGTSSSKTSASDIDLFRPASGSARPNVKRQREKAAEASKGLPISYALLGANVILYSAGITHALGHGIDAAQGWFGLFANSQLAVLQHHEFYRLASASLMHGSLLHLVATSLTLFNFAPGVEKKVGGARFAAIYAASAIAGNAATLAVTDHAAVGANGALFGIAGALLAHQWKGGKLNQPAQAALYLAGLVALNVVANYASNTFGFAAGNLGGFVTGAALGLALAPTPEPKQKRSGGAGERPE